MSRYFGIPLRNGLPLGLGSIAALSRAAASGPLWLSLVQQAEAAAAAAGASLWYVPPASYADRSVNGPFVGSDGSGGVPALGSGVVGWLRDRRDPNLGPERVSDPELDNPAAWNFVQPTSGSVAMSGGTLQINSADGSYCAASMVGAPAAVVGRWYRVEMVLTAASGGGARADYGGVSGPARTSAGTWVHYVVATGTSNVVIVRGSSVSSAVVASVSVREIPGNHATQSTSANRPVFVPAPGAAAAADGFGALLYDSTDLLVAPLASSGAPGYWDMQDNGTERTTPAAATTTTLTLQVPNTRRLMVAVAATGALPTDLVTKARALANYIRGA